MRKMIVVIAIGLTLAPALVGFGQDINEIMKGILKPSGTTSGNSEIAAGLKEALSKGTTKATQILSRQDGYFKDEAVKILLPTQIQQAADVLKAAGYQKDVDKLILSMNRAAEKAAPKAKPIFMDAIKNMSLDDARNILGGGNTAATEYFKAKTSARLADAFKPTISQSMNGVGVARAYKAMTDKYTALLPLLKMESPDLDTYITNKALDGLFYKIGQEEMSIRTNPAARTTELLKKVFGN
jgi:hypothetical protein